MRSTPQIYCKDLEKVIGAPQDYNKNKESDQFPESYDLRLPGAERDDDAEKMEIEIEVEEPTRLQTPVRTMINTKEEVKVDRTPREELMISPAKDERPAVDYMPIKALN